MRQMAILGGGAAGLCCACETAFLAAQKNRPLQISVFEALPRVGKKLLATGNGRCNLTNLHASPADYNENARAFVVPALTRFGPQSTLDFFARLGLFTHADAAGRVYPLSNQAAGVLDALRLEAARLGVKLRTDTSIETIQTKSGAFILNKTERFDLLVLACGGKAAVKTYNAESLLRQLGVPMTKTAPSLVKLTTPSPLPKQLAGIRAAANLRLLLNGRPAAQETGELQFADGVLSGICAMNLSPVLNRFLSGGGTEAAVEIDFVPSMTAEQLKETLGGLCRTGQRETCEHLLSGLLPKQVGLALLKAAGLSPSASTASLTGSQLSALCCACKSLSLPVNGTRGYADAQVMLGGASLDAFRPETLEAKSLPGLFCIGELLDVDGLCGGFNLQWAFASARLCASAVAEGAL